MGSPMSMDRPDQQGSDIWLRSLILAFDTLSLVVFCVKMEKKWSIAMQEWPMGREEKPKTELEAPARSQSVKRRGL